MQLGEAEGYHHGCYREGWLHWSSRGYSPAAIEMLNGIRGLDLLASRAEVDPERLGVTGISGGGATAWWIAAADERVAACSPVCGTATVESHIYDRVIDGHCDCMWWVNTGLWDLADVGALIAPRPLLIASANQDGIFPIHAIRQVHAQLELPDGRGPAIEMLNCLRYTDLPQVAGLLYPAEISVSGELPSTYAWAEDLYRRLGPPGTFRRAAAAAVSVGAHEGSQLA